jgi:hypothetical protein
MKKLLTLLFLLFAFPALGADLTLNWTDNSNNEDGFNVERKLLQTGTFAPLGAVGANVTTFVDPVPDGQLYCYRVNAFNAAGASPWSSEACGQTLSTPLGPSSVTITVTVTVP